MTLPLEQLVHIPVDQVHVEGLLVLPAEPVGVVLFAHGSGSSRHSPRNNYVAGVLHARRVGTLLLDLLTPGEDQDYRTRFDIDLLTRRLGGRPDLAGSEALGRVACPTLLLVGSRDEEVLELNRQAASDLRCAHHLSVVSGATHLFEEPGTLEAVARQAADWFKTWLPPAAVV